MLDCLAHAHSRTQARVFGCDECVCVCVCVCSEVSVDNTYTPGYHHHHGDLHTHMEHCNM